ncbi:MAG: tripartite tricarboxylate transporter substrate binding protein [Alphaproteobacteria bacterium]|nr:tripartite tricarboxylate transporter substrate binding protein [Alphaproteobacteria bacterium]
MSEFSRRSLVIGTPALVAAAGLPVGAFAQESADAYPSKDVKFVCAFPAGSGADVYVRYFAERMKPIMKRNIVVDNRVGAIGNIATTYTARSKPDGYTIFVHAPSSLAANMHLFKKPPVDAVKEIQVAATINIQPFMLTVGAKSPHKTMDELVKAVRAKGDKASFATTNPTSRVSSALFKRILDLKAVEVQYRTGADTLNDMNSGVIDYCMHDPVTAIANTNNGRLRILGVTTRERMKALPDVPSLHELGAKGLDVPGWWGAMVPAATPKPIVNKLNAMWRQVIDSEETRQFMAKFGADTWSASPEEAQKKLAEDVRAWGEYIKVAGIEPQG